MSVLRHRCRHCRRKLPEPTDNERKRFCDRACWKWFHRTRCIVCNRETKKGRGVRLICKARKCRLELRRWPHVYKPFEPSNLTKNGQCITPGKIKTKSATITISCEADNRGRPWLKRWRLIAGPSLSGAATMFDAEGRAAFQRIERQNQELIRRAVANPAAIFQMDTSPLNVCGGYTFPDVPEIDLKSESPSASNNDLLVNDGHASGMPAFLRRAR